MKKYRLTEFVFKENRNEFIVILYDKGLEEDETNFIEDKILKIL